MSAVELVVTDLDGTFWDHATEVAPSVLAAVAELERRGVPLLVATGRRLASTREPLGRVGLAPPAIVLNGAMGLDLDTLERFHLAPFPVEEALAAYDAFVSVEPQPGRVRRRPSLRRLHQRVAEHQPRPRPGARRHRRRPLGPDGRAAVDDLRAARRRIAGPRLQHDRRALRRRRGAPSPRCRPFVEVHLDRSIDHPGLASHHRRPSRPVQVGRRPRLLRGPWPRQHQGDGRGRRPERHRAPHQRRRPRRPQDRPPERPRRSPRRSSPPPRTPVGPRSRRCSTEPALASSRPIACGRGTAAGDRRQPARGGRRAHRRRGHRDRSSVPRLRLLLRRGPRRRRGPASSGWTPPPARSSRSRSATRPRSPWHAAAGPGAAGSRSRASSRRAERTARRASTSARSCPPTTRGWSAARRCTERTCSRRRSPSCGPPCSRSSTP